MAPYIEDSQRVTEGISQTTIKTSNEHVPRKTAVLHASLKTAPSKAVKASGCFITTAEGRHILDASAGAAVASIGHGNQRVKDAIVRQLDDIGYCYAPFFTTDPAEKLCNFLCESTGGKMSRAFVCSSGTEAIEAAMKMARQYFLELPQPQTQRWRYIARGQSYHGNTLGALTLGGHVGRKAPYSPILAQNTSHVAPCYPYRDQKENESTEDYVKRLAQELEDEFQRLGPDTVCAFVAETMAGLTLGSVPACPGYWKAMREVCDRHGALLIMDEVMSGIGRTGTMHAWEQEDVVPDLQTIAKGLGGGYQSVGALLVSEKVVDTLDNGTGAFTHSQTYQGHPVACAAAYEVQQIIKDDDLLANVRKQGDYMGALLNERLANHPHVGDIRGRGLFYGIEFVKDKKTKQTFPPAQKVSPLIHKAGMSEYDICVLPGPGVVDGFQGDVIVIAPPYIINKEEVEILIDRVEKAIRHVLG